MLALFCAIILFLWTPVSARILALVLQLYERNKLKLKPLSDCQHRRTELWLLAICTKNLVKFDL